MSNWIQQLKTNFGSFIKNDRFEHGSLSIALEENNRERILCTLTAGQMVNIKDRAKTGYSLEMKIQDGTNNKYADLTLIHNDDETNPKILWLNENKITDSITTLEHKVKKGAEQLYDDHFKPLKDAGRFIETTEGNNLFLSVSVFNPELFLERSDNLQNYLNSTLTDAFKRFKLFGFLILTISIDSNTIRSRNDLTEIFNDMLHNKVTKHLKTSTSFTIPHMINLRGQITEYEDIHEINARVQIKNLEGLPFYNANPTSQIANTRDYDAEEGESLEIKILESLLVNYASLSELLKCPGSQRTHKKLKNEAYRSLGAKDRIIAYNQKQTVVILTAPQVDSIREVLYVTTDMALIDGQHSSKAFINILERIKLNAPDIQTQKLIDKMNKTVAFVAGWKDFCSFVNEHPIGISVTGFETLENAQSVAINQNSIRRQSKIAETVNAQRSTIVKLAEHWNRSNSNTKLLFNKSAYLHLVRRPEWIYLDPNILTPVKALWHDKNTFFTCDIDTYSKFIAKTGSPGNGAIGKNFESSLNWYFVNREADSQLETTLKMVLMYIDKIRTDQDYDDGTAHIAVQDLPSEIERHIKACIVLNNHERLKTLLPSILEYMYRNKPGEAELSVHYALDYLTHVTEIDLAKLDGARRINDVIFKKFNSTRIDFLNQFSDPKYYFVNIANLYIRQQSLSEGVTKLEDLQLSKIEVYISELITRLERIATDSRFKDQSMSQLSFGYHHNKMNAELFKELFL